MNPDHTIHSCFCQDNCEDDVHISVVVKSNEIQQNKIAELFEYNVGDSVEQARFLYAAAT